MDLENLIALLGRYSVCFFPLLWFVVLFLISSTGGWRALAEVYYFNGTFLGTKWYMQSARFRWAGYNNILTIGANAEGLYFVPFFLFRFSHPPLFIPWYDISLRPKKTLFSSYIEFRFQRVPDVYLRLHPKLVSHLATTAGNAWPGIIEDGIGKI